MGSKRRNKVHQTNLPVSPKPFGCQYGLERGQTFVDVPVYEHVIIFGPVADFHCGALQPGLDLMGRL
ncbi:MAG: hypothetical protein WBS14_02040, partial [Rhodomicrobium sp.]